MENRHNKDLKTINVEHISILKIRQKTLDGKWIFPNGQTTTYIVQQLLVYKHGALIQRMWISQFIVEKNTISRCILVKNSPWLTTNRRRIKEISLIMVPAFFMNLLEKDIEIEREDKSSALN